MIVFRCIEVEGDHLAVSAALSGDVVLVMHAPEYDGAPNFAEHRLTPDESRAVAEALRAIVANEDPASRENGRTVHGVWLGFVDAGDVVTGLFVSLRATGPGTPDCAINISREDAERLAAALISESERAEANATEGPMAIPAPAGEPAPDPAMMARGIALAIAHGALDRPDVDLAAIAEWVRTGE